MAGGSGPKFATLESLRDLIDQTVEVEIEGAGLFELRQISVLQFIEMQETATDDDGDIDEWVATKLLLSAAVVQPPLGDDEELIGMLPVGITQALAKEIARVSGTDEDFGGGSPTE